MSSEYERQLYVEKVDGTCVRLEPVFPGDTVAGAGISAVIVETVETTPLGAFWGTAATCHRFHVIVRRVG